MPWPMTNTRLIIFSHRGGMDSSCASMVYPKGFFYTFDHLQQTNWNEETCNLQSKVFDPNVNFFAVLWSIAGNLRNNYLGQVVLQASAIRFVSSKVSQHILHPFLISSAWHWCTHTNVSRPPFAPGIPVLPNEPPQTLHIQVARTSLAIACPSSPSWWLLIMTGGWGGGEK